jgi:hypothetical protein
VGLAVTIQRSETGNRPPAEDFDETQSGSNPPKNLKSRFWGRVEKADYGVYGLQDMKYQLDEEKRIPSPSGRRPG